MSYTATSASSFINTLGVNVHISWPGIAPYSNTAQVMSSMNYLGLHNMRDQMNSASVSTYNTLASNGFHFDLMYNQGDALSGYISQVHNLEAAHPGSVLSLEGPNEVNSWASTAAVDQQNLFKAANADALLANKPVYAATIAGLDQTAYSQLAINGYADNGNVHIYYNGGMPSYGLTPSNTTWSWSNWLSSGNWDVPNKPVVVTETGAATLPSDPSGVDEPTQAKQILDAVMDAAKSGVPSTYLYELVNLQPYYASGDINGEWGLFKSDWTPKLAATALHNFTSILTDGGAMTGAPGTLDYNIQGTPQWGGQMLFQEGDGTKDIVVWAEPDIWNENSHTAIAAPNTPITIDLAKAANVAIYDPLKGSAPIQVLGSTSHITLNVTDHPLIIEVKDGSGATTSTTVTPPASAPSTPTTTPLAVGALFNGTDGADTLQGAASGPSTINGGGGADSIVGGAGFNQVNGNQGDDTIVGHSATGDWLLGGQGQDSIDDSASTGNNLIHGNRGSDTLIGGSGADTLRGGQGDDVIHVGSGKAWVSGDLGANTIFGGQGADTFHGSAGHDSINGWHAGDHIQVDPGVSWTIAQVNGDVHVNFSNGGEMDLIGVQQSALPSGWITVT